MSFQKMYGFEGVGLSEVQLSISELSVVEVGGWWVGGWSRQTHFMVGPGRGPTKKSRSQKTTFTFLEKTQIPNIGF